MKKAELSPSIISEVHSIIAVCLSVGNIHSHLLIICSWDRQSQFMNIWVSSIPMHSRQVSFRVAFLDPRPRGEHRRFDVHFR